MNYIDTLEPLDPFFAAKEYATAEDYEKDTGLTPPPFNVYKPIKRWVLPLPASTAKTVLYKTLEKGVVGQYAYNMNDMVQITDELIPRDQLPVYNLPPKDFNFTAFPDIPTYGRPLVDGFTDKYEIVRTPDGFSFAARNKEKYAKYLSEVNTVQGNAGIDDQEFKTLVLTSLIKILTFFNIK